MPPHQRDIHEFVDRRLYICPHTVIYMPIYSFIDAHIGWIHGRYWNCVPCEQVPGIHDVFFAIANSCAHRFYGKSSASLQGKMWRNAIMFNAYRWCDETQSENRRVFLHETTDQIKCLTCIQTLELRVCFPIANESESQDVFPRSGDETEFPIFVLNGTRTDVIPNFFHNNPLD